MAIIYCPRNSPVKNFRNLLCALWNHSDVWQLPSSLSQKHTFSLVRFHESDLEIGSKDRKRDSRKAGTRTDIDDPERVRRQSGSEKERLAVMHLNNFGRALYASQIHDPIPPIEDIEVLF